jgi:hypothetical protein
MEETRGDVYFKHILLCTEHWGRSCTVHIWISLDAIIAKKYSKVQIKREILKEKNIKRLSKKKIN